MRSRPTPASVPTIGPQILVGMSAGGVYVREYYASYPRSVVGMVLVDSSHEQRGVLLPQSDDAPDMWGMLTACASLNQSHSCWVIRDEIASFAADLKDPQPPRPLGDLPLVVLSQGDEPEANEQLGITREFALRQRAVWDVLQQELTALSSRGERRVADKSGHVIQFEQPELVITAIRGQVVEARGSGGTRQ
jgi:pimeloyl-ACP methyl ester carboxylesterase